MFHTVPIGIICKYPRFSSQVCKCHFCIVCSVGVTMRSIVGQFACIKCISMDSSFPVLTFDDGVVWRDCIRFLQWEKLKLLTRQRFESWLVIEWTRWSARASVEHWTATKRANQSEPPFRSGVSNMVSSIWPASQIWPVKVFHPSLVYVSEYN